jgi:hypothetical protein
MDWLRFHTRTLDNRKAQSLDGNLFKSWVNLLCVARIYDGTLPEFDEIAFRLRCSLDEAHHIVDDLVSRKLVDRFRDTYSMHDWNEHQYVSDNSTERVRKHRKKQAGNVSVTPPEQKQIQNRTEAEAPPLPTELRPQTEYPETLAVIQEHDRSVDVFFCQQLADATAREVLSDPASADWPTEKQQKAVSDRVLARCVREVYATPRKKPPGTGLLLTLVPRIVIGGKLNYA